MTMNPQKKREVIFTIAGVFILLMLLIVVFFTISFAKDTFKTIEDRDNAGAPITRFDFGKLKDIGIIKE